MRGQRTCYLIETYYTPAKWWTGHSNGLSSDALRAVRFTRREDAEVVRDWLLDGHRIFNVPLQVTEHLFT